MYLDEEEVDDQVSVMKRASVVPTDCDDSLGFDHASFKWNGAEERDKGKGKQLSATSSQSDVAVIASESESTIETVDTDHHFELRDLNALFPRGALTLVTGPTASGKSALLVRPGTGSIVHIH